MRIAIILTVLLTIFAFPRDAYTLTYYGIDDGYGYGNITASGNPFDPYGSTAAHPYLPFGTVINVCGSIGCEDVVVNDRCFCIGPDVTKGVAERIGLI